MIYWGPKMDWKLSVSINPLIMIRMRSNIQFICCFLYFFRYKLLRFPIESHYRFEQLIMRSIFNTVIFYGPKQTMYWLCLAMKLGNRSICHMLNAVNLKWTKQKPTDQMYLKSNKFVVIIQSADWLWDIQKLCIPINKANIMLLLLLTLLSRRCNWLKPKTWHLNMIIWCKTPRSKQITVNNGFCWGFQQIHSFRIEIVYII